MWSHDLKSGFHAEPAIVGTTYLVPVDDGTVAAFEATGGYLLWQTRVGPTGILSGLLPTSDAVAGASHGSFFSLAIESGEFIAGSPAALAANQPRLEAAGAGGLAVFVTPDERVEAVDLEKGTPRWTADLGASPSSAPVAAPGGFLIATEDRRLVLLAERTGAETLSFELPVVLEGRPALVGGTLVATARGGDLVAVNAVSGELAWRRNDRRWVSPRLLSVGGLVLAGATDGLLVAIDPLFGESVWERQLRGVLRGFTWHGDEVYVGNQDGTVFAVRMSNAQRLSDAPEEPR